MKKAGPVGWSSAIAEAEGYTVLTVSVSPGSNGTGIRDFDPWRGRIEVRVGTEARGGRANRELVRYLAVLFDLPEEDIVLLRGERSRQKRVGIRTDRGKVEAVLRPLLGGGE